MDLGTKAVIGPGVFANCVLDHEVDAVLDNETFEREEMPHPLMSQAVFTRFWLTKGGSVIERWTQVYELKGAV